MKSKIFNYILGLILLGMTSSCDDDFLEVPEYGRIPSEEYLSNEAEAFSALIGVYDLMQWNYGRDWTSAFVTKVLVGDEAFAGSSAGDQSQYQEIDDFIFSQDNLATTNIWEGYYKTINSSNNIINIIDPTTAVLKVIQAEAKVLRAFNYFELVTLFGGVPLYTENATDVSEFDKPRATEAEVYAQIEKDLLEAIDIMPLKSEIDSTQKYRLSKGAAQAILGKVYLYQEKYSEAAAQFETVISSTEYDLTTSFEDLWSTTSQLGPESVFEIMYSSSEGYDWGNFIWGGGAEANIHIQLMGPRGDDFYFDDPTRDLNTGLIGGWGFNTPSEKIYQAFTAEDSIRRMATVYSFDEFYARGGDYSIDTSKTEAEQAAERITKAESLHDYEGYIRVKYATRADETSTSESAVKDLNYETSWRLIRYADVLLMAAEAYYQSSEYTETQALAELNKVRARAGLADVSVSGTDLFDAIVYERNAELAFEGVRYWDLVRWGLAEDELSDLGFTAKNEHFPIPLNEITSNSKINAEDQNEGY